MGSDLHYGHARMPVSERAKIFVPFDPLKGYREALEERERAAERQGAGEKGGGPGLSACHREPADDCDPAYPAAIGAGRPGHPDGVGTDAPSG